MASVYDHLAYRPLIKQYAVEMKKEHPARTLKWLAERTEIQAPYLTNVLKERAHLNSDQLYAVSKVFDWSDEEASFVGLLHEFERSGNPKRRNEIKRKIDDVRTEKLKVRTNLKNVVVETTQEEYTRFYTNPYYRLVHAFIEIPKYSEKPNRIAACLNLDPKQVQQIIRDLVELKFIAPTKNGYEKVKRNLLLPPESTLFEPHHQLLGHTTAHHLQSLPAGEKIALWATLAANPETREKVHREFMKFIKAIEPMIKEAPAEELYGMRFDLFRWSHEKQ